MSEFVFADKPRLGVGLGAIDLFPGALHKRPSAGLTDDCWHAGIVAIIGFIHFGGRRLNEGPYRPTWRRQGRVGPKSNVRSLAGTAACVSFSERGRPRGRCTKSWLARLAAAEFIGRRRPHQRQYCRFLAFGIPASRKQRHIFSDVTGKPIAVEATVEAPARRRASLTAFSTAGIDPVTPASPDPFTPIGFFVEGVG